MDQLKWMMLMGSGYIKPIQIFMTVCYTFKCNKLLLHHCPAQVNFKSAFEKCIYLEICVLAFK